MSHAKILISGSRGCIGRAFQAYMKREHPIVEVIPLMPFPFSLQAVGEALKNGHYTHFVNCAALGNDRESVEEPYAYFDANVIGVIKHLEMIRQHSPKTRYLNLGTIYENTERQTPYVVSKRLARQVIASYRANHDLYAVTATLGFTEYEGRPESALARKIAKGAATIAKAIQDGRPFESLVLRDLDQTYQWTWAEDVADGMWRMLNQECHNPALRGVGEWDGIETMMFDLSRSVCEYVLATGETHTVREFVERAFAVAGIPGVWWNFGGYEDPKDEIYLLADKERPTLATKRAIPLVRVDPTPRKPMDALLVDSARAKQEQELDWRPKVSFDELVTRMVRADLAAVGLTT